MKELEEREAPTQYTEIRKPEKNRNGEQPADANPNEVFPRDLFNHVPTVKNYHKVRVDSPFHVMSVDLMDWSNIKDFNSGYAYGFIAVDVFSRYVWSLPVKNKNAKTMLESFKEVFKQTGTLPRRIWVDGESGIHSKECSSYLEQQGIDLYTTYGAAGSVYAENAIKKLKKKIVDYMYSYNTNTWYPKLKEFTTEINDTIISTTNLTPNQMMEPEHFQEVLDKFDEPQKLNRDRLKPLEVGTKVRITRDKGIFERFYDPGWTDEIFTIENAGFLDGIQYYGLVDENGEKVKGSFYRAELQPTG